jgi:hypothetical protein
MIRLNSVLDTHLIPTPEGDHQPGERGVTEVNTLTFIVKIWSEELAGEGKKASWRGSITHVGSGKKQYIKKLEEISEKIISYATNN